MGAVSVVYQQRRPIFLTYAGDLRVEQGPYHEVGAQLDVQCSRGRVNNRPYAHCHFRAFLGSKLHHFGKHFVCKVATVRKLKGTNAAIIASLYHFLCNFCVFMVEHRHHAG